MACTQLLKGLPGFVTSACAPQTVYEQCLIERIVWTQLHSTSRRGDRLLVALKLNQRQSKTKIQLIPSRFEFHRSAKLLDCFVKTACVVQRPSHLLDGHEREGVQRFSLPMGSHGFFSAPGVPQEHASFPVDVCVARCEFDGPDPSETVKFTGKKRDSETDLDYFGARYLTSAQGRWMSADPTLSSADIDNPQSWSRYTYVNDNPLRHVDPDGRQTVDLSDANIQKLLQALRAPAGKAAGTFKGGLIQTVAEYAVRTAIGEIFGYEPMASRVGLRDHEYKLLNKVSSYEKGATMVGVGSRDYPGIDAVDVTNVKGVSLKSASNIERVKDDAKDAEESASKAGFHDVNVYIDAPSVSATDASGLTKIQGALGTGTISKIVIFTGNGIVVYQPTEEQKKHMSPNLRGDTWTTPDVHGN